MTYPGWFREFRPHQRDAIERIKAAFDSGVKVVILDAPTGSGKTLIAEAVRQEMEYEKSLYVCSTKSLQDQFAHDFDYAKVLKGRNNYETYVDGAMGDDCTWDTQSCMWCPSKSMCPYEVAKREAIISPLAVVNTSYMLHECNGPGRFSKRDLVIADEADVLEGELLRYVGLDIGKDRARRLGLGDPDVLTAGAKGSHDSWVEWCDDAIEKIARQIPPFDESMSLREIRARKALVNLYAKVVKVRAGVNAGGWIYAGKDGYISWKPIRVDGVGAEALWPHGDRFLLMSATIISPDEVVESLGVARGTWEFVGVGSSFSAANRPVKVIPVANMARKPGDDTTPELERQKMAEGIRCVLARHPGERVLVHAVSYDLCADLRRSLKGLGVSDLYTYTNAGERQTTLNAWLRSPSGVLLAPSLDRGIDLADDKCRVVVVAKMPFPFLGDRQISARLYSHGGQMWYNVQTVRTIVQMTGRATRHADDRSTSYLLDSQFVHSVWSKGRGLFPSWWTDALDWRDRFTSAERLVHK